MGRIATAAHAFTSAEWSRMGEGVEEGAEEEEAKVVGEGLVDEEVAVVEDSSGLLSTVI